MYFGVLIRVYWLNHAIFVIIKIIFVEIKSLFRKSVLELKKAGISTAELDGRILLNEAMKKEPAFVFSHPEYLITNAQYSKFRRYIRRRKKGEPIAYIVGHKEFYGHDFIVNKQVLIPRPESEWLVEKGMKFLSRLPVTGHQLSVLDMGTGSGCLVISLLKELEKQFNNLITANGEIPSRCGTIEQLDFYAVDINKRGLVVAKKNARLLNADEIVFLNSNLFSSQRIKNKVFDLMIANLPYVPSDVLVGAPTSRPNRDCRSGSIANPILFEPQEAIFATENGTTVIKQFLIEARTHLSPTGVILLELDHRNARNLLAFAKKTYPQARTHLEKDLAGKNRYLVIESSKKQPSL